MSDGPQHEDLVDLYENAPCGYVSLFPDGRIAKLNKTLAAWLGRAPEDLTGRPFNESLSFGGRIAFETHLAPMLRLQGGVAEIALDLLDSDAAKIPVIANAVEKRSDDGQHLLTRLTLFKAVDRRKYERDLLAARKSAEAAALAEHETSILREQFIAVLGHDLRNPLAALAAGVRLLERETLGEQSDFVLKEMEKSIARAASLIDDVLDFARGRMGEGIILSRNDHEPLTPVLEQVVLEARAMEPQRPILTNFAIDEPLDCDRQRLGQLMANLVANAITHGESDSAIIVDAMTKEGAFTLSVTNEGDPIPPDVRERLFHPFFRGGARHSRHGLGLGLFIVNEIARAHGGTMEVNSDETGTSFIFSMPIESA